MSSEDRKEPCAILRSVLCSCPWWSTLQQADFCGPHHLNCLTILIPLGFIQWEGPGRYQRAGEGGRRQKAKETAREKELECVLAVSTFLLAYSLLLLNPATLQKIFSSLKSLQSSPWESFCYLPGFFFNVFF